MCRLFFSATFALLVLSTLTDVVFARVVPRKDAPSGYDSSTLEPYDTYHTRYLALNCQNQHGTSFFSDCCHPLLANETATAKCTPTSSASASASAAEATATDDVDALLASTTTPSKNTGHATSTSSSAASTSTSSSDALITGGFGTFFYQNGVAGACGTVHSDSDLIVAIQTDRYGNTGEQSSLCGKQVKVINTANQKSVTCTIADACPTCLNSNSLDLSVGAFESIADLATGEINIEWSFA